MKSAWIGMVMAAAAGSAAAPGFAQAAEKQDAAVASVSTWREFTALAVTEEEESGPALQAQPFHGLFTIGPAAGFIRTRDADDGTWFVGAQARLKLSPFFAAEASATFHQDRYSHGDVTVTQYPVQVSGLLYPFWGSPAQPYIVAGGGWYHSRVDYSGLLSPFESDSSQVFGGHLGVGIDLPVGPQASLNIDIRYIFIDPDFDDTGDEEFDFVQFGLGLNIGW